MRVRTNIYLCDHHARSANAGSSSCAAAPQAAAPAVQQDKPETVTVEDVSRTFLVHLPRAYDPKNKYPVVLILHDADNDALDMVRLSRFDATADEHGAIAVYPNALRRRWTNFEENSQQQNHGGYGRQRGGGGMGGGMGGGSAAVEWAAADRAVAGKAVVAAVARPAIVE